MLSLSLSQLNAAQPELISELQAGSYLNFLLLIPVWSCRLFRQRRLAATHCVLTSAGCRRGAESST